MFGLTVRAADGAAPLGDRGGEEAGLSSVAMVLDRHAPPLTLSLAGGFNFGNKLLAAHAIWPDESGFRAWGGKVASDDLTIAKEQRQAGELACAGVGIMRLRVRNSPHAKSPRRKA